MKKISLLVIALMLVTVPVLAAANDQQPQGNQEWFNQMIQYCGQVMGWNGNGNNQNSNTTSTSPQATRPMSYGGMMGGGMMMGSGYNGQNGSMMSGYNGISYRDMTSRVDL